MRHRRCRTAGGGSGGICRLPREVPPSIYFNYIDDGDPGGRICRCSRPSGYDPFAGFYGANKVAGGAGRRRCRGGGTAGVESTIRGTRAGTPGNASKYLSAAATLPPRPPAPNNRPSCQSAATDPPTTSDIRALLARGTEHTTTSNLLCKPPIEWQIVDHNRDANNHRNVTNRISNKIARRARSLSCHSTTPSSLS